MRFLNFVVTSLAGLAGLANAFQDIEARNNVDLVSDSIHGLAARGAGDDGSYLESRAKKTTTTTTAAKKIKCGMTKKSTRIAARTLESAAEKRPSAGDWMLLENEYCLASSVQSGDIVSVVDLSGCSAVFFFNAAGLPSAFHISAGHETPDGKAAATKVKTAGETVASVTIGAESNVKFREIRTAIQSVLTTLTDGHFDEKPYTLNLNDRHARERFDVTAPSTTVTKSTYSCE